MTLLYFTLVAVPGFRTLVIWVHSYHGVVLWMSLYLLCCSNVH